MANPSTTKGNHMAQSIPHQNPSVNTYSCIADNKFNVDGDSRAFTLLQVGLYRHLYYKLLNGGSSEGYFTSKELAGQSGCTERTVYTILQEAQKRGELTVKNKGRYGLLIKVLKKGWELTKLLKFAFLAYFRDKGLIPYIYTSNTSPRGGGSNQSEDRIGKMCRQAGLNEGQTRAIREQIGKIGSIRNLGGLVKHFINKLKEGAMRAIMSGTEVLHRQAMKEKLQKQAETDVRATLASQGIVEKVPGVGCTIEELDAFRNYGAIFGARLNQRMMELCKEHGV